MMLEVSCPKCNKLLRFSDELVRANAKQDDDGWYVMAKCKCNETFRAQVEQPQSEQVPGQGSGKSTDDRDADDVRNRSDFLESPRRTRAESPAQPAGRTESKSAGSKPTAGWDRLEATIGQLEQKIDNLKDEIDGLRAQVRDIPGDIKDTRQRIQTHGSKITELSEKVNGQLAEVKKSYDNLTGGFRQSGEKYAELTSLIQRQKTSIDETKQLESKLVEETRAATKATAAQQAALDTLTTRIQKQEQSITGLTTEYRSWLKCLGSMGTELLEQFKPDFQHYREQMEATRDRLIEAQAKVVDDFQSEFQGLRDAHKSVQEFLDEFRSPAGLLRMFRAYQTAVAADLDEQARVALLERLPELLGAVEKDLVFWQLKKDREGDEPLVLSRDGRVLAPEQAEEPQADNASPQEVQLVIEVMVQTLKTIQARIVKWLSDCGLERFPNPGDHFDESLHRARKFVPTDQRENDGQIKRVLYSGVRWAENSKKITDALVDVWKYDKS